ncbi:MAG TPA: DUF11 domain-containing protein, partial [Crenotrichaceae bacterium]|nr:DUF11 domain-containing protein [Crenotrichaceae bacterium]
MHSIRYSITIQINFPYLPIKLIQLSILCLALLSFPGSAQVTLDLSEFGFNQAMGPTNNILVNAGNPSVSLGANVLDDTNFAMIWAMAPPPGDNDDFILNISVQNVTDSGNRYPASGSPENNRTNGELRVRYETAGANVVLRSKKTFDQNPDTYTGDVIATVVEVQFASHLHSNSNDTCVSYTSGNTRGQIWETTVIEFFDTNGMLFGTHAYIGYHVDMSGNPLINPPGNGTNAITTTGSVFVAADPDTIDLTDPANPISGTSGPNDSATVCANTIVGAGVEVTGFRITSYAEDVALFDNAGINDYGGPTTSSTTLTNAFTQFTISSTPVDVSVVKNLTSVGPFNAGDTVTYDLTIANAGPDTATGIVVAETLSNLTFVSVSGGSCVPASFPCTIPTLASGDSETLLVTATITADGPFDNAASATPLENDANPANNVDNDGNGGATAVVDVSVVKNLTSVGPFNAGDTVTYDLTIANAGPDTATGIVVAETLSNLTFVSVSGGSCAPASFPCTIPTLASGDSETLLVTATITA